MNQKPSKEQLRQWYLVDLLSQRDIARRCSSHRPTVRKWLKEFDIRIRSFSEVQEISAGTTHITKDVLEKLYTDERKTQLEIANLLGVSQGAIGKRMVKFGIPTRTKSELASGSNNVMYGRTHTPEAREKIRQANKRQFSDPEARRRHALLTIKQIKEGRTGQAYNKLETIFSKMLDELNIAYTWQFQLEHYVFDFSLDGCAVLIETHGTFWHADPRFYNRDSLKAAAQRRNLANDARKQRVAVQNSYELVVFWEHDIHNNAKVIKEKLQGLTA